MPKTKVTLARTPQVRPGPPVRERQRATRRPCGGRAALCRRQAHHVRTQSVARSADREDVAGERRVRLDLGRQPPDVDVDAARRRSRSPTPGPKSCRESTLSRWRPACRNLGACAVDVDLAAGVAAPLVRGSAQYCSASQARPRPGRARRSRGGRAAASWPRNWLGHESSAPASSRSDHVMGVGDDDRHASLAPQGRSTRIHPSRQHQVDQAHARPPGWRIGLRASSGWLLSSTPRVGSSSAGRQQECLTTSIRLLIGSA